MGFSTFLSVMHAQIQQENPRDEILQAVRLMDTSRRGFITASELRARLTGFGERLTDQEGESDSDKELGRDRTTLPTMHCAVCHSKLDVGYSYFITWFTTTKAFLLTDTLNVIYTKMKKKTENITKSCFKILIKTVIVYK